MGASFQYPNGRGDLAPTNGVAFSEKWYPDGRGDLAPTITVYIIGRGDLEEIPMQKPPTGEKMPPGPRIYHHGRSA